ncbi:MAG: TonB-dependent receptor [Myxococcota bacterium]
MDGGLGGVSTARTGGWRRLIVVALALDAATARAQQCVGAAAQPPASVEALQELDLESLLDIEIYSSTKSSQRGAQTPAVVTVVTAEEIQARGYTTLADVLRVVPGFYDAYDLVSHNVGIRGVNGGPRAGGNVLKLMIDNQPVDFRPTTENFFGEELVPLEAVERVEIIRGPASALYGANAFLGVVNVITRCGRAVHGFQLTGHGVLVRGRPGAGVGLVAGAGLDEVDVLVAGKAWGLDRSGLALPTTSPLLERSPGLAARGPSQEDLSRPRTFLGKLSGPALAGHVTLSASIQNSDAVGEFQSFGVLTHGTRVSLINQNFRIGYDKSLSDDVGVSASVHYLQGRPAPEERLNAGRVDYVLVRSMGVEGWGASAEARLSPTRQLALTVGADFLRELHLLPTYDRLYVQDVRALDGSVAIRAGEVVPGEAHGARRSLENAGVYGQALMTFSDDITAIGGVRVDYHSIYGANLSARTGLVYAPPDSPLSVKLLYGSSYKAPSASQLYTQPLGVGDVRGNPDLRPQYAHTVEAATGASLPDGRGEISANLFATNISGRVEFRQSGLFQRAENTVTELVVGAEVASRFILTPSLHLRVLSGAARTVWQRAGSELGSLVPVTNQLFPPLQVHLIGDYLIPSAGLRLSAEASYVGARRSSQSNAVLKGGEYELAPYLYTAGAISWTRVLLPGRETGVNLRLANVFNRPWVDPGFGGIDVPAQGVTAVLTVNQAL